MELYVIELLMIVEGATEKAHKFLVPATIDGTAHYKNCKQFFEYQHLLLLRDIWWSKF